MYAIRSYYAVLYNNLEQQVATRTQELDKALNSLWSEMELAKQIQTCLLPKQPTLAGYDRNNFV